MSRAAAGAERIVTTVTLHTKDAQERAVRQGGDTMLGRPVQRCFSLKEAAGRGAQKAPAAQVRRLPPVVAVAAGHRVFAQRPAPVGCV